MITEAIANWFLMFPTFAVSLLPSPSPGMVAAGEQYSGALSQVINQVANLGPIIPFGQIGIAAGIMLAFIAFATILQVSRIIISVVTLGGGAT